MTASKLTSRIAILMTVSAIALTSVPANAAIPVIDPSAIARIREVVSVGTQNLNAVRQQVQGVQQMKNTIGQIGQGRIGSILQASGLDFSGELGLLRDLEGLNNNVSDLGRSLQQTGVATPQQMVTASRNFSSARQMTGKIFYGATNTPAGAAQVRNSRAAALRESGVASYGLALTTKGHLDRSADIANKLSAQMKSSADLRTDVQANTAAIMALYSEVAQQTAIQVQLLELEAAKTLAGDTRTDAAPK